ncbi:hypothetical protein, partial [Pseudomonas putida]|uniref:hypothetical protein n=1 Tax=Pseudomonas putida TaxID=303 RepID=UPI0020230208
KAISLTARLRLSRTVTIGVWLNNDVLMAAPLWKALDHQPWGCATVLVYSPGSGATGPCPLINHQILHANHQSFLTAWVHNSLYFSPLENIQGT